jgi:predicted nucleic acid-binding protein
VSTPFRLLLDTNVLVSTVITGTGTSAQLLRRAEAGAFTLVASPLLPEELSRVLEREKFRRHVTVNDSRLFVEWVRSLAEIAADPDTSEEAMTADPNDDFLVVLAENEHVDALVSGAPHLTALNRRGLKVLTPRQALELCDSAGPRTGASTRPRGE